MFLSYKPKLWSERNFGICSYVNMIVEHSKQNVCYHRFKWQSLIILVLSCRVLIYIFVSNRFNILDWIFGLVILMKVTSSHLIHQFISWICCVSFRFYSVWFHCNVLENDFTIDEHKIFDRHRWILFNRNILSTLFTIDINQSRWLWTFE